MKRNKLLHALVSIKPGIASKDVIESMTYFYFSGTHAVSYNDRISIQYPLITDFKAFVKADDIFKVISKLKDEEVLFKLDKTTLKMKCGKASASFATIFDKQVMDRISSVDESFKETKMISLPDNFLESIKLCSQVASKNESDQTLTCLYINKKDIVATDNKRIAHSVLTQPMEGMLLRASEMKNLIVTNPIKHGVSKAWIHFISSDKCVFSIRVTKGEYPDMLKFCEFTGTKILFPKEILSGVDLASVFTDDTDDFINVTITDRICKIDKKSESGRIIFREPIDYEGGEVSFNIHPDILKEMLSHNTDVIITDTKAKLCSGDFTLVTSLPLGE